MLNSVIRASLVYLFLYALVSLPAIEEVGAADPALGVEEELKELDDIASDIEESLKELEEQRNQLNSKNKENISNRIELIEKINVLLKKIHEIRKTPTHGLYRNSPRDYLVWLLNSASELIIVDSITQNIDVEADKDKLFAAATELKSNLAEFVAAAKPGSGITKEEIDVLDSKLKGITPKDLNDADSSYQSTKGLVATILAKVPETYPEPKSPEEVKKAAEQLNEALKKTLNPSSGTMSDDNAYWRARLYRDQSAIGELVKLQDTLAKVFAERVGLVVRIDSAWVGDTPRLNGKPIAGRWCDSTAQLRSACDRERECPIPENYTVDLCGGFDAAPSASPTKRGVYVRYSCVPNVESNFAGRYGDGSSGQTIYAGANVFPGKTYPDRSYAILRSKGVIKCSAE